MKALQTVARPMLASMFVYGGIDAMRSPQSKVPKAEKVAPQIANAVGVRASTEQLVRVNGAVQIGAGVMLAFGFFPRLAALVLAGSLVPTTLAGHAFWEEKDPTARAQQRLQFTKNVSMLGGLLVMTSDAE